MNTLSFIIVERSYQAKKGEKITDSLIADLTGSDTDRRVLSEWNQIILLPMRGLTTATVAELLGWECGPVVWE